MTVSIIIPCYNEEAVLDLMYKHINLVMSSIKDIEYKLIFINDGSTDKTESMLLEYAMNNKNVVLYSFTRNFGHQAAVSCGINHAKEDIAIIIDADLQDPPEIIPDMINMYKKTKVPIIYGKRISREGETFTKKLFAKFFYRFINILSDVVFPVDTGDFRLIDKRVIEAYNKMPENPKYIRGLISWMGFEQIPFEYERKSRAAGKPKYTFKKSFKLAMTGILSFSIKPLRIALIFSVISIFIALFLVGYVLYQYFVNSNKLISGWASTMITILFMGGVQLFILAIIGEYLGNIFNQDKKRPEYIIKGNI